MLMAGIRTMQKMAFAVALAAAGCQATEIHLAALSDLGQVRSACVRIEPGGVFRTLKLGQTLGGITLRDLDTKAGWALIEEAGKISRLRFDHSEGSAALTQVDLRQAEGWLGPVAGGETEVRSASSQEAGRRNPEEPQHQGSALLPGSATPHLPGPSPAQEAPPDLAGASNSGAPVGAAESSSHDASAEQRPTLRAPTEGEKIYTLYGQQAYLDWDRATHSEQR